MTTDSGQFKNDPGAGLLPLYEAKLLHQFTHRWATYAGETARDLTADELADPAQSITPRYWIAADAVNERLAGRWDRGWLLGFRDIARSTDERTAIFSLLPRVGVGNNAPIIFFQDPKPLLIGCFIATVSSIAFDFVTRPKVGGVHLNFFIVNQLPVLPPSSFSAADIAYIVPRVVELVYTAWDIAAFAEDVWAEAGGGGGASNAGEHGGSPLHTGPTLSPLQAELLRRNAECNAGADPALFSPRDGFALPPYRWDDERRALIRAELDARIARLYGLSRDELRYILDPADVYGPEFPGETFRVLKEKETKLYGEYRTRRLVLAAWDVEEGKR